MTAPHPGLDDGVRSGGGAVDEATLRGFTAGFVSRAVAFIVDAVVVSMLWSSSVFAADSVLAILGRPSFDLEGIGAAVAVAASLLGLAVGYQTVCVWLFGKTIGKLVMGLRVVTRDGNRPGLVRAWIRALLVATPLVLVPGALWVLIGRNRRAWHDLATGSWVVYDWAARPRSLVVGVADDPLAPRG